MGLTALALLLAAGGTAALETRFREAGEQALAGDHLKAIAIYQELAGSGVQSASLFWNWAQAAAARGAPGEALWACLQARELAPADRAIAREIERLRQALNLDPAEISPEPLAVLGRASRRFHLDLAAAGFLAVSVLSHAAARWLTTSRLAARLAWASAVLSLVLATAPLLASLAGPTGVVVRRGASLLDAASTSSAVIGSLREGEVVEVLLQSRDYLRVEDSSGARGWARVEDVRPR